MKRCFLLLVVQLLAWYLATDAASLELRVSSSSDRSNSRPLLGATVAGEVYIFTTPTTGIAWVSFFLDDPDLNGAPAQTEKNAPYDFAGGGLATAKPFHTSQLSDGTHAITAVAEFTSGIVEVVTATFVVANSQPTVVAGGPSAPQTETASEQPTSAYTLVRRSGSEGTGTAAEVLNGAQVTGNIYVVLTPEEGVRRVRFYLDDPGMTGPPRHSENAAPYDFAGGTMTNANPFDTRQLADGPHTITGAVDLSAGGTVVVHATFTVANNANPVTANADRPIRVAVVGDRFLINDSITYPGTAVEGLLMNVRMVNSTFEDTARSGFDAEANTDEFLAAMPDYVAHGVRAFSLSLQGGNPGYEGAVNTAFRSDGSLRSSYLARVARVIRAADALGAVVILNLYYQRQDEHLADSSAVRNGVINVATWVTQEGFTNVLLEIANEYPHGGYNHSVIRTASGIASLIRLAKTTAPQLNVSASGLGNGQLPQEVAEAADYLIVHFNETDVSEYDARINALKSYGKPIVVTEDPKIGSEGVLAVDATVANGASWGFFLRANQDFPFSFRGAADDPPVYNKLRQLTAQ